MVSSEPTIQVACCCFPDGSTLHTLKDNTSINTAWSQWRESLTEEQAAAHEKHKCGGGVVLITMLAEDWHAMQKRRGRDDNERT